MSFGRVSWVIALALLAGCGKIGATSQAKDDEAKKKAHPVGEIKPTERIRPDCPVRTGGVFLMGLGDSPDPYEESATRGVKLSEANRDFLAAHCDLAALSPNTLQTDTFATIRSRQRLFTPLLYLYASSLYEDPNHKGNVGGWKPEMAAWTLKDAAGAEAKFPEPGGHWMDPGNAQWATHWRQQTESLAQQYVAFGAVAAEMPQALVEGRDESGQYKSPVELGLATEKWLRAAIDPGKYLLLPSDIGFGEISGHTTPFMAPGTSEPELSGRYWDQFYSLTDGAWAEGGLAPYWVDKPLSESLWEVELEAADRAARNDKVFILAAAYRNDDELEYALASYLLVAKRQSRIVFQPMPLRPGQPANAGLSLKVLQEELEKRASYFDAPLGVALLERHTISLDTGVVWRRPYQFGDVYVNSDDNHGVYVTLAGPMRRVNGQIVQKIFLPPHHGAILNYLPKAKK